MQMIASLLQTVHLHSSQQADAQGKGASEQAKEVEGNQHLTQLVAGGIVGEWVVWWREGLKETRGAGRKAQPQPPGFAERADNGRMPEDPGERQQ